MNPYAAMFDPANDVAEHARELAADMAVPYRADPPRIDRMANAKRMAALDDHRRERRRLQAQLAAEQDHAA